MATIKSYTDLEQSKKLAEILPLETADMYYHKNTKGDFVEYPHFNKEYESMADRDINYNDEVIPCWSLVALFSVLPDDCGINKEDGKYVASYIISDECGAYIKDNPIDACVAMIRYLQESNKSYNYIAPCGMDFSRGSKFTPKKIKKKRKK